MKVPEASGSKRAGAAHGEAECSLQPMEIHGEAGIHLWRTLVWRKGGRGCLKEAVTPREACAGAPVREEPAAVKSCSLWGGLTLECFMKDGLLKEGPLLQQGKDEEEKVVETINV